jgi:hypothetical protein
MHFAARRYADCTQAPTRSSRNATDDLTEFHLREAAMGRLLEKLNTRLRTGWLHRSIVQALALNRSEVRPDGLGLTASSLRLAISWRARDLHPWDLDLVGERRAVKLVEQTFLDTQTALERLFMLLPEVDVIDLRVLETDAGRDGVLMSGSIERREFETWHPSSPAMRLKLLGLNYHLVNSRFEPLEILGSEYVPKSATVAQDPDPTFKRVLPTKGDEHGPRQPWHQDRAWPH